MRTWTRREAVKTMAFWSIALSFMLALGGQIAYLVHQVSFLGQYLGPQGAATAVAITACASIVGRLFLGTFVDRCDKRYVTMVCVLIQGIAVLTLAFYSHVVLLYLCTFAFGLTMGSHDHDAVPAHWGVFRHPFICHGVRGHWAVLHAGCRFRAGDCRGDIRCNPKLPGVVYPVCCGQFCGHGSGILCEKLDAILNVVFF